jgi:hypothetical protein
VTATDDESELWLPPTRRGADTPASLRRRQELGISRAHGDDEVELVTAEQAEGTGDVSTQRGRRYPRGSVPALVASAARININDKRAIESAKRRRQQWQSEAWDYYDEIPEIGYTIDYKANLISKVRLFAAVRTEMNAAPMPVDAVDSGVSPSDAATAKAVLERLRSAQGGQSAILRELSRNFGVSGECYLHGHEEVATDMPANGPTPGVPGVPQPAVGQPGGPIRQTGIDSATEATNISDGQAGEDWQIRSIDELIVQGDTFALRTAPGARTAIAIPNDDLVVRLWERHPRYSSLATCAMRRVLSEAEALMLLSREIRGTSKSRLSNGILLMPDELSFGSVDPTRASGDGQNDDPFDEDLNEAMITPIQEEGSASSVVPLTIRGPAEFLDKVRHISLDRALDPILDNRIEARVIRIARGLNMPVEVTTGLMACVDPATEMLTEHGWRTHDRVAVGDLALTLNHETGQAEWQPVQAISVYPVTDHPMLAIDGKAHSSLSTLDHRWPVVIAQSGGKRAWKQSGQVNTNHRFVTAAPGADLPVEAKWTDAMVELVAWFYTEGSVDRRAYRRGGLAIISQDADRNPGHVGRIAAALTAVAGPPAATLLKSGPSRCWGAEGDSTATEPPQQRQERAWTQTVDANRNMARFRLSHALTAELEAAAPDRVPTPEFIRSLTAGQLELFLTVSRLADGWTTNSGTPMFSQGDARRVDPYELAAILSGRTPSRWSAITSRDPRYADRPQHFCSITDRTTIQPHQPRSAGRRFETVSYTGDVWCPTTPNQTWLARRHGRVYFTGNTTFANAVEIKKSEFEDHVEPSLVLICDAITSGYYQWSLEEAGVAPEVARTIFCWYDAADIVVDEDETALVTAAHDALVINNEAYRRRLGFTEEDAPQPDEMLLRIILASPRMDPFISTQLLRRTGLFPDMLIPSPPAGVYGDLSPVSAMPIPGAPPGGAVPAASGPSGGGVTPDDDTTATRNSSTVTGSAAPDAWAKLGRTLAGIDRELRTRIAAAADQAMRNALRRAGNQIKGKVQRGESNATLRAAAEGVDAFFVAQRIGRPMLAAAGITDEELLAGAFSDLRAQVGTWLDGAYGRALAAVAAVAGPVAPGAQAQLDANHVLNVAHALDWLETNLTTLAATRLYDPTGGARLAQGEHDPTVLVPMGLVRAVVAVAGGAKPKGGTMVAGAWVDVGASGAVTDGDGNPVGGVATGPDVMGAVAQAGGSVEGWQWDYGAGERAEFQPHLDLSDTVVPSTEDPQWANNAGWPDGSFYFPGDHDGCVCDIIPILTGPDGSVSAQISDQSADGADDAASDATPDAEPDTDVMAEVNPAELPPGATINEDGKLVDSQGRMVNAKGKLVNKHGKVINEAGQRIDSQGRLLNGQGKLMADQSKLIPDGAKTTARIEATTDTTTATPAFDPAARVQANDGSYTPGDVRATFGSRLTMGDDRYSLLQMDLLNDIDERAVKLVNAFGTKISIGDAPVDDLPGFEHLKGIKPRGYGKDLTWHDSAGVYSPDINRIGIGHTAGRPGLYGEGKDAAQHEFGHALDAAAMRKLGDVASQQADFLQLYNDTKAGATLRSYFLQPGKAGPSEAFAEAFKAWTTAQARGGFEGRKVWAEFFGYRTPPKVQEQLAKRFSAYFDGLLDRLSSQ